MDSRKQTVIFLNKKKTGCLHNLSFVRQRRFELPTLRSVAVCSIQLSY